MASWIEELYGRIPSGIQNLAISIYGLGYYYERFGGNFGACLNEFRERDRWTLERMRTYLEKELRRNLLHAFDNTLYYRERWQAIGILREDLEKINVTTLPSLPMTPKEDMRRDPQAFLARNKKPAHSYLTSGSTGTPLVCYYGPEDYRKFIAAREVRSFGWAGTSIRRPRSMIGGRGVVPKAYARPPFYRYNFVERQIYFSAFHISPANVPDYVAALNRYRPRVFTGYAYSHYLLGRMMLEQKLVLDYEPEALIMGSEKMSPEMKQVIQTAFRARAYEEYGAVENCVLATECEKGSLHVNPDFGIVEIVDEQGQPVPPGKEGRILCTGLLNEVQPLIRYEIGDFGIWSGEKCSCGREAMPVLKEISGRMEDVVVGPDGREMVRFHGIFVGLPEIIEGQVIQEEKDFFHVRVVSQSELTDKTYETIRARFFERLGPVRVQVERVPVIERTERGKFRAVISRIKK